MVNDTFSKGKSKEGERIVWIDWAKVILIWLMVMGHAGLSGYPSHFIYAFHMPAFFILSGFLFRPKRPLQHAKMFVPIIIFATLTALLVVGRRIMDGENVTIKSFFQLYYFYEPSTGYIKDTLKGQWFIIVLFEIFCIMCIPILYRNRIIVAIISVIIASTQHNFYLGTLPARYSFQIFGALPFFVLGVEAKSRNLKIDSIPNWFFPILLLIYIVSVFINKEVNMYGYKFGEGNYITFFITAVSAAICLFKFCSYLPVSKFIERLSSGTLITLGIHIIIVVGCSNLLNQIEGIKSLVLATITLLITYPIVLLLKKRPILLGK